VRCKGASVKSSKDLQPLVQSRILSTHGQKLEKNLIKNAKMSSQVLTSRSSQTNKSDQVKLRRYRFVHSDGTVELFTDTTVAPDQNKSQIKSNKHGHKQASDSEDYLTPSETEPDDSEFMSENPVSLRQVRGLKESEKLRRCQFGDDADDDIPVFYSTNRRQRKSTVGKQHGRSTNQHVSQSKSLSFNHRHGRRRNGSSDDSSDSDSDKSSDDNKYNDELPEFDRSVRRGRRRNSSKENESSDEERFKR